MHKIFLALLATLLAFMATFPMCGRRETGPPCLFEWSQLTALSGDWRVGSVHVRQGNDWWEPGSRKRTAAATRGFGREKGRILWNPEVVDNER